MPLERSGYELKLVQDDQLTLNPRLCYPTDQSLQFVSNIHDVYRDGRSRMLVKAGM